MRGRRGRIVTAVVLVLAVIVASCANSEEEPAAPADGRSRTPNGSASDAPGVTEDEIRFASISTITANPLGSNIGPAYNEGIEAYFAWRNSEGGLDGRELVLETIDDQLGSNADRAQEVVSSGDAFAVFVATLLFTGADILDSNGVPTFGWGIHPEFNGRRNLFGHIAPICPGCPNRIFPYLASEEGGERVGVLAYNTNETSRECAAGQRESIEVYGDEVGGLEVAFFDDNLSYGLAGGLAPQVSAMKEEEVDFVTACMDLNGMKVLAEELAKQGMDDVVLLHPNSYDAAFVEANADIFEGDLVLTTFTPFETEIDSELQRKFFEWTDETDVERREFTMIGWINAHLAYTAMEEAGELDRAAVVDAARALTGYTADNLIAPIDWSVQLPDPAKNPDARGELQCGTAVRVEDGEFVQATGEEAKPWVCWDDPNEPGFGEPRFIGDFE